MDRGDDRVNRVAKTLDAARLDAVLSDRPNNVLMMSGYWPVTGAAVAVATAARRVYLLVPKDEEELARQGWADEVRTFEPGSLDEIRTTADALRPALASLLRDRHLAQARIGSEREATTLPAPYVALFRYGDELLNLLKDAAPDAALSPADELLAALRQVKTSAEIERIKLACGVARTAFESGARQLRPGLTEAQAAAIFRQPLSAPPSLDLDRHRAEGFVYCMSGPNGYEAFAAYQRSRSRRLAGGDLVLIHCNSCVDGFWTDITRTFVIGEPDERQRRMYQAVFAARAAALAAVRPGVVAADVDRAARDVMTAHGFGDAFKHPTGHGVGFAAIDHNASPRIHPKSPDVLDEGMTFNIEPGIYVQGYGGMRNCDMVAVTSSGYELLTPFQCDIDAMAAE